MTVPKVGDQVTTIAQGAGKGRHNRRDTGELLAVSSANVASVRWNSHGLKSAIALDKLERVTP